MLERGIAALLRVDPDTRARLSRLDGRVVRVRVSEPALELALAVVDGRVDVLRRFDGRADVSVSGTFAALRSLRRGNDALYRGDVRIEGDVGVAQGLSELLRGLDVDVEELVEPLVGGTLARRLALAARDARAWFGRTRESVRADVEEYLKEESGLLAAEPELRAWCADVDELRGEADRLEARVARLERRDGASR